MRNYLYIGFSFAALVLAGWLYYIHTAHVRPAPKDLTLVFPKPLLEKATKAQLAVLRGEATTASKASDDADAAPPAAPAAAPGQPAPLADPAGLQVTLVADQQCSLKGQAANASAQPVVYARPAGTLFSNGEGDVVLLKDVSVEVPAKGKAPLSLPVAQTTVGEHPLTGRFTPRVGAVSETLRALVDLLAHKQNVSPSVAQTAVLIVNDDAPLDMIASFPRLEPPALVSAADQPFSVSPGDLIAALRLIQEAGLDPARSALMSEPQLKVMTLLNPDSHPAAMEFYGLSEQTEWSYWKKQLLDGDPALRHYAFYGIARYYPAVALDMLPRWVRDPGVYRSYRLSAAWALALVDDARAQQTLVGLRQEFQADAGLRQTLDRALQHWSADNSHPDGHGGKTAGNQGNPARPGNAS